MVRVRGGSGQPIRGIRVRGASALLARGGRGRRTRGSKAEAQAASEARGASGGGRASRGARGARGRGGYLGSRPVQTSYVEVIEPDVITPDIQPCELPSQQAGYNEPGEGDQHDIMNTNMEPPPGATPISAVVAGLEDQSTAEGNLVVEDQVLMEMTPSGELRNWRPQFEMDSDEIELEVFQQPDKDFTEDPLSVFDSGSEAEDVEDMSPEELYEVLVKDEPEDDAAEEPEPVSEDFTWSEDFTSFAGQREGFHEVPGANIEGTSPSGLFTQLWDRDLMESIAVETNKYAWEFIAKAYECETGISAQSRVQNWVETSAEELYRLVSVIILMGMCVRGRIQEYWTTGVLGMPDFRKRMSKSRFYLLMRFLHFADNNLLTTHGPERKLAKVKPILDHLNRKFSASYTPRQELCIDESLLLWKGHLSWVQCLRSKAVRFGIKSYELCEAVSGYVLNMMIYTGADAVPAQALFGFTSSAAKIVIKLIKDYLGKGFTLFMGNLYNSVRLCRFLKSQRTDVVGTLKRGRADTPAAIRVLNDKKLERGKMVSLHCGDIAVVSWKDDRLVTTVSTYHHADVVKSRRRGKDAMKPAALADYSKYMGGVELKDQKLSMYLLERKRGIKWYIKVFKRLLNISILNSYIIYTSNIGKLKTKQKILTHRQFRYQLAEELAQLFSKDVQVRRSGGNSCARLNLYLNHFPEHCEVTGERTAKQVRYQRGRCARCAAKNNTMCSACKVFLCVGQCWKDYHTLENL